MAFWSWLGNNWSGFFNDFGLNGNLCVLTITVYLTFKSWQITNLIALTSAHLELWKIPIYSNKLGRVEAVSADLKQQPLTSAELNFIRMVFVHQSNVFYARKYLHIIKVEGVSVDIADFLSLPVPAAAWEKFKKYHNRDFVAFVESCLAPKQS